MTADLGETSDFLVAVMGVNADVDGEARSIAQRLPTLLTLRRRRLACESSILFDLSFWLDSDLVGHRYLGYGLISGVGS